jgi:RNA 2',3'-cyclic 3'-phosphodiesterase
VSASQLPETSKARVFFALWPGVGVQLQLLQHGRELHRLAGGRLTRPESIHLTLVFLGDIGVDRLEDVRAAGAGAAFAPFELSIDSAGCWNHNRVAWLAPRATPAPLQALVDGLEARLQQAGFRFDARAYAPHITVIRKAHCGRIDIPIAPVEWRIEDFVLVRAQLDSEGSRYTVIGRWPEH